MKLTKAERLILVNQLEILEKLSPDATLGSESAWHKTILERGYAYHYEEVFSQIFEEVPVEDIEEVLSILDMFRVLHFSFEDLEDKSGITEYEIRFHGFDGNNETTQYAYATNFIIGLGRYEELKYGQKVPSLNSHTRVLERYNRMRASWDLLKNKSALTRDEIISIVRP